MTNDIQLKNTVSTKGGKPKQKRRRIASLDRRKARSGWLFVLPFVIGFVLIYLPVIFDSVKYSFERISVQGGGGLVAEFVGWQNYREALIDDPKFAQTLVLGIQELLFDIPAIIIFSLFMAVLLNQKMAGRAVFRAIFFIPVILSTGLMESINAQNIMAEVGEDTETMDASGESATADIVSAIDIEYLFANMKVGTEIVDYVVTAINNIYDIVNRSGVQMLIFLAGLQSISPAIYESCRVEGATSWETFWKITFPMISPMILVNAIYTIIDSFTDESNKVMRLIEETSSSGKNGDVLSSAMAWLYFLVVLLIIGIFALIAKAFVFYQRRD